MEQKVYPKCPGHMTNMAAMPVKSINLSNVRLWNQWTPKALKVGMWHTLLDIMTWIFYGKVKYGKMLEHKISWKVLKICAKNVQLMTLV